MNDLIWKVKNFFRKYFPHMLVLLVVYGVWTTYTRGGFRRGIVPGVTSMMKRVPVLGSAFKGSGRRSYYSYRGGRRRHFGRRHHGRRHHRRHR